jgi:hypothetical protein
MSFRDFTKRLQSGQCVACSHYGKDCHCHRGPKKAAQRYLAKLQNEADEAAEKLEKAKAHYGVKLGLRVFQFSLKGWEIDTGNDHLVKWVKAPSKAAVNKFIAASKLKVESGIDDDLPSHYDLDDGVDVVIDANGEVVRGEIGDITPG